MAISEESQREIQYKQDAWRKIDLSDFAKDVEEVIVKELLKEELNEEIRDG